MRENIINNIVEQFIYFSLNKRQELFQILVILIFLLFLIRKNRGETTLLNQRKKYIDKALGILSKRIKPKNEYKIPKEIEKKLCQNNFNKASVLMLIANIMKHLNCPNSIPGITINKVSNDEDVKPGFCYTYPGGQANITINILPEYDINVISVTSAP